MKRFLALLPIFALLGAGCAGGNEVTVYPVYCGDPDKATGECQTWIAEHRRMYRIDSKNHTVLEWDPDDALGESKRYTKCAVVDIDQWSCKFDDESGSFGFSSGEYFFGPSYLQTKYVVEREWRALRNE